MNTKEVRFDIWCLTCEHWPKDENETPCRDCMLQGWNEDSTKPIYWEEKKWVS